MPSEAGPARTELARAVLVAGRQGVDPAERSVLIVDDDPHSNSFAATVAELCGFRARVAASANQAWAALDPEPTLILLDLQMPDTDGIEMLRELASRRLTAEIRIFSGSSPDILRTAARIGRDLGLRVGESIAKPATLAALRALFVEVANASDSASPALAAAELAFTREDLAEAISAGQLFVVFQPILDLATLEPVGAEALVRWRHPLRGIVPPGMFVALAESSGLVYGMTEQVLTQALAFASRPEYSWNGKPLALSVNLATAALIEGDPTRLIMSLLAASGVAPGRLVVEVTESVMQAERTRVLEIVSRLRLRGVELSIDDFGTGTSSLERLDQFPCTELKIERAFVTDLLHRREAAAIVRSTLELARRLGLRTVGEGIEDAATWHWLRDAGCDTGQGFYFSRGVEASDFLAWLEGWELRRLALLAPDAGG